MKNLILLSILFISSIAFAQTPFSILSSHENKPAALSAISLNNPWVGAKLAYNITGDASNSFLLSARALYIVASGDRWALPIIGNVGLDKTDSLSADNGVSLGLFPYYSLTTTGKVQVLVHGGLNYHVYDRPENGFYNQVRMLAGLECALYGDSGGSPITLSVAPEYIINTGPFRASTFGINFTGVLPIANGLGLLIEGIAPLSKDYASTGLKIGVIVNSDLK